MAEAPALTDDEIADPVEGAPPKTRLPKKKVLIIAGGALLLLLIASGIAAFLLLRQPKAGAPEPKTAESESVETFVDVPAMVVNLRSSDGAARLIKLHLMLVPATVEKGAMITTRLPLIIDRFQPFLRELRPEDLAGSAAVFRIKEELLVRANEVTGAGSVKDVLIQDLIQQ